MLFNSIGFAAFLVVVMILYYLPILTWTGKKGMLLFFSYLFYALWNPPLILLLWISTLIDWTAGNKLYSLTDPKKRKMWLWISMLVNLGFLGFFKYGGFLLENFILLTQAIGIGYQPATPDIILPMGISFYTFQTMSYTIDLYYRRTERARTFLDFALYVTFFPQLVAGPIVRSSELITQFYKEKKATLHQFLWGLFLLTLGLFQKMVLADTLLSKASDKVFGSGNILHFNDAWTGTLAFSGQIFFDFAGYSTCAIGIALMLGIILPENFRYPYAAIGFSDLWRRWHITLSSWLRDYLYIPMGGNRRGPVRTYVSLMTTMLLGGLWHGAAWTFVFWGFLHGMYLVAERFLRKYIHIKITPWKGFIIAAITYFFVNISWVFFRAPNFSTAWELLGSMFYFHPDGDKILGVTDKLQVWIIAVILFLVHWFMRDTTVRSVAQKTPWWILSIFWAILFIFIMMAQGSGEQFIYFQF